MQNFVMLVFFNAKYCDANLCYANLCTLSDYPLAVIDYSMTLKELALSRFTGEGVEGTVFIPDFTLWYEGNRERDKTTPIQIADELGIPAWLVAQPWRIEYPGATLDRVEEEDERVIRYKTSSGTLQERWKLIPSSGWWQVEYPIKSSRDFKAAIELVDSRSYVLEADSYFETQEGVGDGGIAAIKTPTRPFSYILNDLIGWTQGLVMLRNEAGFIDEISALLEPKLHELLQQLLSLPGTIFYSPDNLDAQFISPALFSNHFSESYKHSTGLLHGAGRRLVVHTGGPIRSLLGPMAESGIDAVQGISPPPQSDASLSEARSLAGSGTILWGGISQDYVMEVYGEDKFESTVQAAVREAREDAGTILGVSDRVPVEADLSRIRRIAELARENRQPRP
jgi:hypothetical protein